MWLLIDTQPPLYNYVPITVSNSQLFKQNVSMPILYQWNGNVDSLKQFSQLIVTKIFKITNFTEMMAFLLFSFFAYNNNL